MEFERFEPRRTWLKRQPFLRLMMPLLVGIAVGLFISESITVVHILFFICIILLLALQILPISFRHYTNHVNACLVFILVCCTAIWVTYKVNVRNDTHYFLPSSSLFLVVLNEAPVHKANSGKALATVQAVFTPKGWKSATGKIMIYWPDSIKLEANSRFITNMKPLPITNSGNPGSFDYKSFCANQQLFCQAYLHPSKIIYLKPQKQLNILSETANRCVATLKRYMGEGPEAGMAEALLIGYKQDLDKNLVQYYSNTGIVHIIAISGMHLALLYSSLLALLKYLPKRKMAMLFQAIIILVVLWSFALLTGASASVLRAVVMCSVMLTGKLIVQQPGNSFNAFIASGFLLLCFDPYLLFDLGFQLSYLAVAGILIVYPPLYRQLKIHNRWLDLLWQSVAVSLSAQLLTTPVSLYYFHQFPNYFLLANLVTVPLSTVIIYGEVLLLLSSPLPIIPIWVGKGVWWLVHYMNTIVIWLAGLPGATVSGIPCNAYQAWLMYGVITFFLLWKIKHWRKGVWLAIGCLWAIEAIRVYDLFSITRQQVLIVYNLPKQTIVDCINGGLVNGYTDTANTAVVQAARAYYNATPGNAATVYNKHLSFAGKRITIVDTLLKAHSTYKLKVDYLVLTHSAKTTLAQLDRLYEFKTLIITAFNKKYMVDEWKQDCRKSGRSYYDIREQGAFILNIR